MRTCVCIACVISYIIFIHSFSCMHVFSASCNHIYTYMSMHICTCVYVRVHAVNRRLLTRVEGNDYLNSIENGMYAVQM